ncbi:DUF3426 domain-containing protein [Hydrogenophaga sp.]|uniref:DUF3426 domain-containing protein n=1 Tax=Hydrogenophaga sp. TaxID=1904254 RepID=UPI0025B7EBE1|nr:DUF3426 domain-containing protein [Hydrogenophaga sp.]
MSLTTRCPACATTFRVVPDQLKLSDGWVRCGHCADVFDATRYLETWTPQEPQTVAVDAGRSDEMLEQSNDPFVSSNSDTGDGHAPLAAAIESFDPVAPPSWQPPVYEADVGLGNMPIANHPEDVPEAGPQAQQPPDPDPAAVADVPASTMFSVAEADPPADAELPAEQQGFTPTDVAPLDDGQREDLASPPEPDNRDELDRLLDRVLNEEAPLEPEDAAPDAPWPEALPTPVAPSDRNVVSTSASEPTPLAKAEGEDTADFHADLKRYAASLKKPELAEEPGTKVASSKPAAAPELEPVRFTDDDDDLADGAGLPAVDEPEFVRQARRRAFWQSPAMRGVLLMVALLLAAALAGQWALHERDRLAAVQPELKPWLVRLCEPLGCEVQPVRDIDAIVIDSSTLVRRLGNFYSFDLVLKNTSSFALAVPALELSLTDTGDTVISRRVFLPEELPGVPTLLPAQGSVPVSLRLSLAVGDQLPMAGYRALIFYP